VDGAGEANLGEGTLTSSDAHASYTDISSRNW
jgi:hypothetical protein